MGLIKEPVGVDLVIAPSVITEKDKQTISGIIAAYKLTGKIPRKRIKPSSKSSRLISRRRKKASA